GRARGAGLAADSRARPAAGSLDRARRPRGKTVRRPRCGRSRPPRRSTEDGGRTTDYDGTGSGAGGGSPAGRQAAHARRGVGAAGVQLGQGSLTPEDARRLNPRWWIGKSVHDLREAEAAHAGGADYLLVGPVFPTATHPDRAPLGSARLKEIAAVGLPVIVIGGVTPERIPALLAEAAIH